jgi:hypothetical protein
MENPMTRDLDEKLETILRKYEYQRPVIEQILAGDNFYFGPYIDVLLGLHPDHTGGGQFSPEEFLQLLKIGIAKLCRDRMARQGDRLPSPSNTLPMPCTIPSST